MRDLQRVVTFVDVAALVEVVVQRVLAQLPQATTTTKLAYTPATLAVELGVTSRTIRAAISRGELRAVKRAGKWLIPADAVSDWTGAGARYGSSETRRRAKVGRSANSNAATLKETLRALDA